MMHKTKGGMARDYEHPIGKGVHADKMVSNSPGADHHTGNASVDGFTKVKTVHVHSSKMTTKVPHGRG